jgi:hypothetical protein
MLYLITVTILRTVTMLTTVRTSKTITMYVVDITYGIDKPDNVNNFEDVDSDDIDNRAKYFDEFTIFTITFGHGDIDDNDDGYDNYEDVYSYDEVDVYDDVDDYDYYHYHDNVDNNDNVDNYDEVNNNDQQEDVQGEDEDGVGGAVPRGAVPPPSLLHIGQGTSPSPVQTIKHHYVGKVIFCRDVAYIHNENM